MLDVRLRISIKVVNIRYTGVCGSEGYMTTVEKGGGVVQKAIDILS